jgi:hypothetical protein
VTAAVSPSRLPQSSTGRFDVSSVEVRSYRRMMISSRSSAAVCGSFRMPRSSNDEERHGSEIGEVRFARAVERGAGEFLEQRVRFAIALLDHGAADGLSQVAFSPSLVGQEKARLPVGR